MFVQKRRSLHASNYWTCVLYTQFPISKILQTEILREETSIRKLERMKTNKVLTSTHRYGTSKNNFTHWKGNVIIIEKTTLMKHFFFILANFLIEVFSSSLTFKITSHLLLHSFVRGFLHSHITLDSITSRCSGKDRAPGSSPHSSPQRHGWTREDSFVRAQSNSPW